MAGVRTRFRHSTATTLAAATLVALLVLSQCDIATLRTSITKQIADAQQTETVGTPTLHPGSGTYSTDQLVTIDCVTPGATVYFTIDGPDPTTSSDVYKSPIGVGGNGTVRTIKALAAKAGMRSSTVVSATYAINYSQVSTPAIAPASGEYSSDQLVTITCSTSGATIYYTIDGSSPTTLCSPYTSPISVAGDGTTMTIKAIGAKEGMNESTISTAVIQIVYDHVAAPQYSVAPGTYHTDQSISLSCSTAGADIHYTTNGSDPTLASPSYSAPIALTGPSSTLTIKALAVHSGMVDSNISTGAYTVVYQYSLTVNVNSALAGSTNISGTNLVDHGVATAIIAAPNTGYSFTNWTGGGSGCAILNANAAFTTVTVTSPGPFTIQANYRYLWTDQSAAGYRGWMDIAMSPDGSKVAACAAGDYIYTSSDGGVAWTQRTSAGARVWRSISSSASGAYLAACVQGGNIYTSTDYGANWTSQTGNAQSPPANQSWYHIAMSADGVVTLACVHGGSIYVKIGGGMDWYQQTSAGARNWVSVSVSENGTYWVACDETPGYVWYCNGMEGVWRARTTAGLRNWKSVLVYGDGSKLAACADYDNIRLSTDSGATWTACSSSAQGWHDIAASSDGTSLAACTLDGHIWTSNDSGVTWVDRSPAGQRWWSGIAITSDGSKIAACDGGIAGGDIYTGQ